MTARRLPAVATAPGPDWALAQAQALVAVLLVLRGGRLHRRPARGVPPPARACSGLAHGQARAPPRARAPGQTRAGGRRHRWCWAWSTGRPAAMRQTGQTTRRCPGRTTGPANRPALALTTANVLRPANPIPLRPALGCRQVRAAQALGQAHQTGPSRPVWPPGQPALEMHLARPNRTPLAARRTTPGHLRRIPRQTRASPQGPTLALVQMGRQKGRPWQQWGCRWWACRAGPTAGCPAA